jgi:hypothetical protein
MRRLWITKNCYTNRKRMAKAKPNTCFKCEAKLTGKVTEPNLCLECYLEHPDNPHLSIGGEQVDDSTY